MDDNGHKPDMEPFPLVSGRMCYATAQAVKVLKHGTPGNSIDRQAMAATIGRDCGLGSLGYGNVNSAIRHVENHHGVVWRWDKATQAWVCLDNTQCVQESQTLIHSARKRARRSLNVAKTVDQKKLDDDTRREHNLNVVVCGMLMTSSSSSFRKKLNEMPALAQPDTAKVLGLFRAKEQG